MFASAAVRSRELLSTTITSSTTSLDDGLRVMAAWVREQGARSSPAFDAIEIRKHLPAVWANT